MQLATVLKIFVDQQFQCPQECEIIGRFCFPFLHCLKDMMQNYAFKQALSKQCVLSGIHLAILLFWTGCPFIQPVITEPKDFVFKNYVYQCICIVSIQATFFFLQLHYVSFLDYQRCYCTSKQETVQGGLVKNSLIIRRSRALSISCIE